MEWHGNLPKTKKHQINNLSELDTAIIKCRKCPRLVEWREEVAQTKRKAYQDHEYWGKPVPGFGVSNPKLLIVGLAPGAHGANRTGRVFTGDASGDWLYEALHKAGLAKISTSTSIDDGQKLFGSRITCAVHCAPPDNKPSNEERDTCANWLQIELDLVMPNVNTFVVLGKFAFDALIKNLRVRGHQIPSAKFGHGAEIKYEHQGQKLLIICSYHPSQQNTFTGKLTKPMLNAIFKRAAKNTGLSK